MPLFGPKKKYPEIPDDLIRQALIEFITAPTWEDRKKVMRDKREFILDAKLSQVDEIFMDDLWKLYDMDKGDGEILMTLFTLIDSCRKKDIDEMFEDHKYSLEITDIHHLGSWIE